MFKECARWSILGQGEAERAVLNYIGNENEMKSIKGLKANELITLYNKSALLMGNPIMFKAKTNGTYFIYYAYHSNSGDKTVFQPDGTFEVLSPTGGSLSAFFSEVVILEKTGQVLEFKRK